MQPVEVLDFSRFNNILEIKTTKPAGYRFDAGDYTELGVQRSGVIDKRWMSIAVEPAQPYLRFITKIPRAHTDYKACLSTTDVGDTLHVSPAIGNFNVPKKTDTKLLFIAQGIGITPFLALIPAHANTYQIELLYTETAGNFYFKEELSPLKRKYFHTGELTVDDVDEFIESITNYVIYLAGSPQFCLGLEKDLLASGAGRRNIKLEYFEGY